MSDETPSARHRATVTAIAPAVTRPSWARRHALHIGTVGLGLIALALGWAYRRPELTRPIQRPGARVYSLVQYIDGLGPIWVALFWITGGFLIVSVFWERKLADLAHGLACGAHGMFAAAVLIGFFLSDPRPPLVSSMLALIPVLAHAVFALLYSSRRP